MTDSFDIGGAFRRPEPTNSVKDRIRDRMINGPISGLPWVRVAGDLASVLTAIGKLENDPGVEYATFDTPRCDGGQWSATGVVVRRVGELP